MIYLDNSATTRTSEKAVQAALKYMQNAFFNPSSAYGPAVEVERAVNGARSRLAEAMGCTEGEIYYTSGGTESNNMAIFGTQKVSRNPRYVTTAIEHASVYEVFHTLEQKGMPVLYLEVAADGSIRLDQLEQLLRPDVTLVSMMHVNNETGAVNDIASAYAAIKRIAPGALFHVDGVQAFCKLPFGKLPCDLYSISGHKFHGPKGVGALYVRHGIRFGGGQIGGGQEKNMRSGTTNAPGIMAMDAALSEYKAHQKEWVAQMQACKMQLASQLLRIPDAVVNGPAPEHGAPHILNVSFPGVRGEVLLHALERDEIYVSTGSACSAHKKGKNRILSAMGIQGDRQEGAIRFSLCPHNTLEEMDTAAVAIARRVAELRRFKRR